MSEKKTDSEADAVTEDESRKDDQILKCRDDKAPVILSKDTEASGEKIVFRLAEGSSCSWLTKEECVGPDKLRPRIEPWLTALFQSEHFSLLVGSGLTHALHWMAADKKLPGMDKAVFSQYAKEIDAEAEQSARSAERGDKGNIEDQIRVANELLRGLEILVRADDKLKATVTSLKAELVAVLNKFANSILEGERGVISAEQKSGLSHEWWALG